MNDDDLDIFTGAQPAQSTTPAPPPQKIDYSRRKSSPPPQDPGASSVAAAPSAPPPPDLSRYDGGGATVEFTEVGGPDLSAPVRQRTDEAKPTVPVDKYVRALAVTVGIPFAVVFIGSHVPELQAWSLYRVLMEQFAPAVGSWPFVGDVTPFLAQAWTLPASLGLVVACALVLAVWSKSDIGQLVLMVGSAFVALMFVIATLTGLFVGSLADHVIGVLLAAMAAALAVRIGLVVTSSEVTLSTPSKDHAITAAVGAGVLFLPALAVGRWATASDLTNAVSMSVTSGGEVTTGLASWATALQWFTGVAIVGAVGGLIDLAIAIGRRSLVGPAVTMIVAIGVAVVIGGFSSTQSAAATDKVLSASPAKSLSGCETWSNKPTSGRATTFHVTGSDCSTLDVYSGSVRIFSGPLGFSAKAPQGWLTTVNTEMGAGTKSAAYGPLIVIAGADQPDFPGPTVIGGFQFGTGAKVWEFRCPASQTMAFSMSGSDTGDRETQGRVTPLGKGAVIATNCGGQLVDIDPQTGRPV